eukprot:6478655-Amphidinium_carterae.1
MVPPITILCRKSSLASPALARPRAITRPPCRSIARSSSMSAAPDRMTSSPMLMPGATSRDLHE